MNDKPIRYLVFRHAGSTGNPELLRGVSGLLAALSIARLATLTIRRRDPAIFGNVSKSPCLIAAVSRAGARAG